MPLYNPAFLASGPIKPARFVKISGEFTVAQCALGDGVIGVAQEGTFAPPNLATLLGGTESGLAADIGKSLKVFGLGDVCVVLSGADITAGTKVQADSDGKAIPVASTTGPHNVGGIALNSVLSGEKVLIQVNPHVVVV